MDIPRDGRVEILLTLGEALLLKPSEWWQSTAWAIGLFDEAYRQDHDRVVRDTAVQLLKPVLADSLVRYDYDEDVQFTWGDWSKSYVEIDKKLVKYRRHAESLVAIDVATTLEAWSRSSAEPKSNLMINSEEEHGSEEPPERTQ
jgi:hypothetical protein